MDKNVSLRCESFLNNGIHKSAKKEKRVQCEKSKKKKRKVNSIVFPDYSVFSIFILFITSRANPEYIYFSGTQSDRNIIIIGRN